MSSPTVRTMAMLKENGYLAGIVEKRNWHAGPPALVCPTCRKNRVGKTQDLFVWCDIIAVPSITTDLRGDGRGDMTMTAGGTFYVQTTSRTNHHSRRRKIVESEEARRVLNAHNRIWIITWDQPGGYGTRWRHHVEEVTLATLDAPPPVRRVRRKAAPAEEEE